MATLVLSTVGTALGGPVGAAIGALIGQSIDQQILGPSSKGPRLGDLSVQTSSYGTQVPRIYGAIRVAGSVIWATDLAESSATSGAKGQPDTVFSYSVSLAVALSSRPISSIGRIWADGKLLRGEDGVFKVATGFRFYEGSEDQPTDPLLASIEGLDSTPAYRGLALAVFENIELAEFGNRIPFLTFEVIADSEPTTVSAILEDATAGIVRCEAAAQLDGYAAHGPSIRSAIDPLINAFGVELTEEGGTIRSPHGELIVPDDTDLGCSATGDAMPQLEREQAPSGTLPAALRLSYYEPARDFQAGEARASAGEPGRTEERQELPAVLSAGAAKSLAEETLARRWARRDKLTLHLSRRYLGLQPGALIQLGISPRTWVVERCTIDGFALVAELRPSWSSAATLSGDSGRMLQTFDPGIAEVAVALFEVPSDPQETTGEPTLLLAASSPTPGWKRSIVEIDAGWRKMRVRTAARKSVMGRALSVLGNARDEASSVEIELIDKDQWLTSCDPEALGAGANLAVLGKEIIKFGDALPIAPGRFRLARLVRGCGGTEGAMAGHAVGDRFLLLDRDCVTAIAVPDPGKDSHVTALAVGSRSPHRRSTITVTRGTASQAAGTAVDGEARAAIAAILETLRMHGLAEM